MPCKVNVWVKDGKTVISGLRPTVLAQLFPHAALGTVPQEVEKIITSIVDEAKNV